MNLLRGTLDFLVLKGLAVEPRHGYGVARWVRRLTDGVIEIDDGAWGVSENNRRAKYYSLTSAGRARLQEATDDWAQYVDAVGKILNASEGS